MCIFRLPFFRMWSGALAQLGERGVRNAEVRGSIPLRSTDDSGKGSRSPSPLRRAAAAGDPLPELARPSADAARGAPTPLAFRRWRLGNARLPSSLGSRARSAFGRRCARAPTPACPTTRALGQRSAPELARPSADAAHGGPRLPWARLPIVVGASTTNAGDFRRVATCAGLRPLAFRRGRLDRDRGREDVGRRSVAARPAGRWVASAHGPARWGTAG